MMPGERAVLERLALELEILNRRTELREARKTRPVLAYDVRNAHLEARSAENRRHLDVLERELATAVASRPKRESPWPNGWKCAACRATNYHPGADCAHCGKPTNVPL